MAKASAGTIELTADQRVVVLHGPEAFLRSLYTDHLRSALTKVHGEIEIVRHDGKASQAVDVLDDCRSFGLIQQHKLVIVDDADEFLKSSEDEDGDAPPAAPGRKSNRQLIESYCASPSESATLLLRCGPWRGGKLDKLIPEVGAVIACEELSDDRAVAWVGKRATSRYQATIDVATAALLVERLGTDLGRLDSELSKLSSAAGEGKPISGALVRELVGVSREEEVWGVQQTLLAGDARANLTHVRELVSISRVPTQQMMWAITDLARKIHGMSAGLRAGMNPFALAGTLKLWGPGKDAVTHAAHRTTPTAAAKLLGACIDMDARTKSGLSDQERAIDVLAVRFADPSIWTGAARQRRA
ncbi:MAG: DNA polymerase III subunit delta [Phycisphaerae bacterium]|nr:DNA polymerase III subunit delta [Phycisphaerae bacterium]